LRRLPESLQRLIEAQVDTFEKLEIAVELAGTPGQAVERAHLAAGLSMAPDVFTRSVLELEQIGLLAIEGDSVGPSSTEAVRSLDELLRAYRADGVTVIRAISEIAIARIRGMGARSFADAFRVRSKRREDRDG
jgi:hypothetical protein